MPTATAPADFEFDVFISYSSKDEEWVTKTLLPRLEGRGIKACIDFRDFIPGKAALHNMRDAVKRSRRTLLVMTPNWVASEWTVYEELLARSKDPAGVKQRTIPLLRAKCDIPEDIAILTYINFTRADREEIAWGQVLTACGAPPAPIHADEPKRDNWELAHPYPMPPNFTGRVAERKLLSNWLVSDDEHPLLVVRALGGFGKSALAWHWLLHDVSPASWPRVVWWSFYEGDASFDNFLARTVEYLTGKQTKAQSLSPREQLDRLVELLHQSGILLVLDGFERVLRAFGGLDAAYRGDTVAKPEANDCDCVNPIAEDLLRKLATLPGIRSRVLMTTRLRPHVLEAKGGGLLQGCREEELSQMEPEDAVAFFRAQGVRGTHTEIEQACLPYGFHPLSLRLLAGLIVGDFQQPGDIAVAKRLDVSGDLVARQHHVLEVAYNSLTEARRALLSRIACFRSPVKYDVLKALAETEGIKKTGKAKQTKKSSNSPQTEEAVLTLDADLRDLVSRGLLHHDKKEHRFDLHPIVRRYAYDRMAAPDRTAAHAHLRNYFAAMPAPDKVTRLDDLAPVIELYHHTVSAGQYDEACKLFYERLGDAVYYQLGAYQVEIDLLLALFPNGESSPPRLKNESAQSWVLTALANSCSLNGQPRRAVSLFERQNAIEDELGNMSNIAVGLRNMSGDQLLVGDLQAADSGLRRSFKLCQESSDEVGKAISHSELGHLLIYRGEFADSESELSAALAEFKRIEHVQSQHVVCAYSTLRKLLMLRVDSHVPLITPQSALISARRVLELADETARALYAHERDYIRAHWLLGAAHHVASQYDEAECHLHEALERCRHINTVDHEADILIDLARLRAATGKPDEAQRLAEEALNITERCGYVLQGADANLELAKLALARGDKATALEHAKEARKLATCDGPPDYTYKVAYDEAGALLKELGEKI